MNTNTKLDSPSRLWWPLLVAVCIFCTGCETLRQSPKVDFAQPTIPLQIPVEAPQVLPATGGIYMAARYRPFFEDRRPRMVGDSLTIQIVENVTAKQTSTSTIDRAGEDKLGVTALPLLSPTASILDKLNLGASSATTYSGKGGTESANTFTGAITTTVVQVLPNGHLVVSGEKQIGVNENVDVLRFTGTVDPRAILPNSIVSSTAVANVRIESKGRGAQGEVQAMGWFSRFFMNINPF